MPGLDVHRFVGLEDWLAKELSCSICLEVLNNAVDLSCRHTFCKTCITSAIGFRWRLVCPECRHESEMNGDWGEPQELKENLRINSVISKLKIRCNFAANGCEEIVECGLLADHEKSCPFGLCAKCDLPLNGEHDCIALLKNEINKLKSGRQLATDMADGDDWGTDWGPSRADTSADYGWRVERSDRDDSADWD